MREPGVVAAEASDNARGARLSFLAAQLFTLRRVAEQSQLARGLRSHVTFRQVWALLGRGFMRGGLRSTCGPTARSDPLGFGARPVGPDRIGGADGTHNATAGPRTESICPTHALALLRGRVRPRSDRVDLGGISTAVSGAVDVRGRPPRQEPQLSSLVAAATALVAS